MRIYQYINMPVSTRSNQKRWPPRANEVANDGSIIVGSGDELTLPPDLYWNYVEPYLTRKDRPILNKRSGSTQFYAGKRVEIVLSDYQHQFGDKLRLKDVPTITGTPGTPSFTFHNDEGNDKFDPSDEDGILAALQNVRDMWDEHMSKITSPSKRLNACLELFYGDERSHEYPLLFPGEGTVEYSSLYIELYLGWCHDDIMHDVSYHVTGQLGHIVQRLFELGGDVDVTSYFQPMQDFYPQPFYCDAYTFTHVPGMTTIDCMKRYLYWQRRNFERGISGFGWVIDELEARKPTGSKDSLID